MQSSSSGNSFTFLPPPPPPGYNADQSHTYRTWGSAESPLHPVPFQIGSGTIKRSSRYDHCDGLESGGDSPDLNRYAQMNTRGGSCSWEMGRRPSSPDGTPQPLLGGPSPAQTVKKGRSPKGATSSSPSSHAPVANSASTDSGGEEGDPEKWSSARRGHEAGTLQQIAEGVGNEVGTGSEPGPELDDLIEGMGGQVDVASYLLGERTALERALKQVVPQREQLGQLKATVNHLQTWTQQDSARLRRLESAGSGLHVAVGGASERLQALEKRIPEVEGGLLLAQGQLVQVRGLVEELAGLRAAQAALAARQNQLQELAAGGFGSKGGLRGFLEGVAKQLASYAVKADVALLAVAKKILFDRRDDSLLPITADMVGAEGSTDQQNLRLEAMLKAARQRRLRSALGAALMVFSVETVYRLQLRARKPLPRLLKSMTSPVEVGLKIARICVWVSAFLVGAQEVKQSCFATADALLRLQRQMQRKNMLGRTQHDGEEPECQAKDNEGEQCPPLADMV